MDQADIPALLARLASDEDTARKMAVFKLQTSINDPAFADVFISSGGLIILRRLIMSTGGNTLAYSLQSLSRLLEVDMGWDIFEGPTAGDLVERIVELIVTNPLVNILRGAMSILVALVSHSQSGPALSPAPPAAMASLQSADHALCANALMLINALIRDAVANDGGNSAAVAKGAVPVPGEEWSKFIKRLQDLGLIKAVYNLMQSSALQDLAHPLLEFQSLTKVLLRKWREGSRRHNPEKWRRLGFESESPAQEFDVSGFLGMMDLTDYVRKNEDGFQKLLLEQSARPLRERCPVARASLAVTMTLYQHFEVDKVELEDPKGYQLLGDIKNNDGLFRPLLLQWSRLHTAGLHAFFRIWKATMAELNDFEKTKDVLEVEDDLMEYDCGRLRELQMELLELSFEDNWGLHLQQVRDELKNEALQFVKEQRVRCLLEGSWFYRPTPKRSNVSEDQAMRRKGFTLTPWRFARLSHNKRFLHYADFADKVPIEPALDSLTEKVDLSTISSVVSNVSAPNDDARSATSISTAKTPPTKPTTKITVYSFTNPSEAGTSADGADEEKPILTLYPTTHSLASEWLDGLLMLLNQAPITAETNKLVYLVSEYGLKIRLLNVRFEAAYNGPPPGAGAIPSREGLDEDYYYEV
ncbi:unnamed protein product [Parascedosporium putredinis]|uniref:ELMO domain-containing protein n=1 Tax=Parascedosporium putredinis TaxID=1442378 RepID=A0A9P1H604_9PEZI|nr:unnamed protein product [Parascedosporium putredinis]CAI7998249.1 unnamed protein product [Parascedosporium putredinis]